MAEPPPDGTIFDEREESLLSPAGGIPTLRIGHFLKPSVCNLPSDSVSSVPRKIRPPLKVSFNGWRNPPENWTKWVHRMRSQYQSKWDQAGIHEPIMNSTYKIHRHSELVLEIAEKWCPETNTFVFKWGESTLSLEDMLILGGYSVLGHSVSVPVSDDFEKIKEKLLEARLEVTRTKAARASQSVWMNKFMANGSEIEHEAFLALWLSRFVFPAPSFDTISKAVFPIAIHLARGTKIALAPAVLASIYRDLSILKTQNNECKEDDDVSPLAVWSPFQLVQVWAWERFPTLRGNPNPIENDEPRFSRWHNVKKPTIGNLGSALDSGGECFLWRPYATGAKNRFFDKFYREKEEWIPIGLDLDDELESFVRCLRVSELVGVDCCVEQYLPHRVAMQFGMDQDLPGNVVRSNATPEIAWNNYNRPIRDGKMYVPSRLFESDVTSRYLEWWKTSRKGPKKGGGKKKGDGKKVSRMKGRSCDVKMEDNHPLVPPGFSPKDMEIGRTNNPDLSPVCNGEGKRGDSVDEDKQTLAELVRKIRGGNMENTEFQIPPSSNESVKSMESKKIMSDPVVEEQEIVAKDEGDGIAESRVEDDLSIKNIQGGSDSHGREEMLGLELEARVMKLEKAIAMLKAQRFGNRFESTSRKGPSMK